MHSGEGATLKSVNFKKHVAIRRDDSLVDCAEQACHRCQIELIVARCRSFVRMSVHAQRTQEKRKSENTKFFDIPRGKRSRFMNTCEAASLTPLALQ
jgi:hypothetical protein